MENIHVINTNTRLIEVGKYFYETRWALGSLFLISAWTRVGRVPMDPLAAVLFSPPEQPLYVCVCICIVLVCLCVAMLLWCVPVNSYFLDLCRQRHEPADEPQRPHIAVEWEGL